MAVLVQVRSTPSITTPGRMMRTTRERASLSWRVQKFVRADLTDSTSMTSRQPSSTSSACMPPHAWGDAGCDHASLQTGTERERASFVRLHHADSGWYARGGTGDRW